MEKTTTATQTFGNRGKRWPLDEDAKLKTQIAEGMTFAQIAVQHGRTELAIDLRVAKSAADELLVQCAVAPSPLKEVAPGMLAGMIKSEHTSEASIRRVFASMKPIDILTKLGILAPVPKEEKPKKVPRGRGKRTPKKARQGWGRPGADDDYVDGSDEEPTAAEIEESMRKIADAPRVIEAGSPEFDALLTIASHPKTRGTPSAPQLFRDWTTETAPEEKEIREQERRESYRTPLAIELRRAGFAGGLETLRDQLAPLKKVPRHVARPTLRDRIGTLEGQLERVLAVLVHKDHENYEEHARDMLERVLEHKDHKGSEEHAREMIERREKKDAAMLEHVKEAEKEEDK